MRCFLLSALLVTALLPACDKLDGGECSGIVCGPNPPAIDLRVHDTSGAPVVGAHVTAKRTDGVAVDVSCGDQPSIGTFCQIDLVPGTTASRVGVYDVHVEADGFAPSDTQVTVPATPEGGCCNPGYTGQEVDIKLAPL